MQVRIMQTNILAVKRQSDIVTVYFLSIPYVFLKRFFFI